MSVSTTSGRWVSTALRSSSRSEQDATRSTSPASMRATPSRTIRLSSARATRFMREDDKQGSGGEPSHFRERLELVAVVVHRVQQQLARAGGCEVAQLLGTCLRRPADGHALRQAGAVVHAVEDRRQAVAGALLSVLDRYVNALSDRECLAIAPCLVQLLQQDRQLLRERG